MNYSTIRVLKYAGKDFWRNIWLSIVTITVLTLALLSVNILISLKAISGGVMNSVQNKVDISVFYKSGAPRAAINNFQQKMKQLPEVKEVIFVAKEQALENFKEKHKDDQAVMEALKEVEKNPLLDATIVRANGIDGYKSILGFINLQEYQNIIKFQNYTDHQKIIERVSAISAKVEKISITLTLIFAIIAVLIVFNAIRVTIYTHREEIAVMRLVGASNSFIRAPFLAEGVLYSSMAIAATGVILYIVFLAVAPYLSAFLETYSVDLLAYFKSNLLLIFLSEFCAVILLNVISASLAMRRYLKV